MGQLPEMPRKVLQLEPPQAPWVVRSVSVGNAMRSGQSLIVPSRSSEYFFDASHKGID